MDLFKGGRVNNKNTKKIVFLWVFPVLLLLLIVVRVAYLQLWCSVALKNKSQKNLYRKEFIPPCRGSLLDCNGRSLATNCLSHSIVWHGKGLRRLTPELLKGIEQIELILGIVCDRDAIARAERKSSEIEVANDLSFEQLCILSERGDLQGRIEIKNCVQRTYPYGNLASHILGYLSRAPEYGSGRGRAGLECVMQDLLVGHGGTLEQLVDARGKPLQLLNMIPAQPGKDITLTLNLDLQEFAETLFDQREVGAFVVIDPVDGALKASCSFPNFDPNRFLSPISHKDWQEEFVLDSPLINRVFASAYPPGSIFKLITYATGFELGVFNEKTKINCSGFYEFGGRKYYCTRSWGHGRLTAKQALAYSCNPFCYAIGKRVGIENLANFAHRFGLGMHTGSLINDNVGIVPSMAWKNAVKGESWWAGETISASIGQTYLLATPLQAARMISGIFTGYLVAPRILENEAINRMPIRISRRTLLFLQDSLKEVATCGTARMLGKIQGVNVFAKTSTAQTSNVRRGKKSKEQLEHAWCAAFFYPYGGTPLVALALVENAGKSRPAVVAVEKFIRFYVKWNRRQKKNIAWQHSI